VARKSAVSRSESAAIKRLSPGSPILPLPRKALKNLFFWAGRGSPLDEFTVYKRAGATAPTSEPNKNLSASGT
jgi:hypothetical protein